MIPLTESIVAMFGKWFKELKSQRLNDETVLSQIEYERVILNKICCIAEDLKFYKLLDSENYYSIQNTLLECYKKLNSIEYIWVDEKRVHKYLHDYKTR